MNRLALILCLLLTGCASVPATKYAAEIGQASDSATTWIALQSGFVEANPVVAANMWILAAKPLIGTATKALPTESCRPANRVIAHLGYGFGAYNIAIMAASSVPVAMAAGIITIPALWDWLERSAEVGCQ